MQNSYSILSFHILFLDDTSNASCCPYFCIIKTTQNIAAEMKSKVFENLYFKTIFSHLKQKRQ